jgi:hypothetical protein
MVVWAGAVTVYPEGFEFMLLTLYDARTTTPPASWALDIAERGRMTWLEVQYPEGRRRAADLNANNATSPAARAASSRARCERLRWL